MGPGFERQRVPDCFAEHCKDTKWQADLNCQAKGTQTRGEETELEKEHEQGLGDGAPGMFSW